jgi:hypothetical protein
VIKQGGGKHCSKECYKMAKTTKIKCVCKECGKEFYIWPSRLKNNWKKYCSKECMSKGFVGENNPCWRGGKIKRVCEMCGEIFVVRPNKIKNGGSKYCSIKCSGEAQRNKNSPHWKGGKVKRICKICGDEFFVSIYKIKTDRGKYCSRKCMGKARRGENAPNWNGGTSFTPYCPKFNERRKKAVRDFFDNTCLTCGKLASENVVGSKIIALSVHHSDHDKEQGCNGKPFNLVPLCHDCHIDELNNQEEYQKYINNTLEEGFRWGIWNEEEYIEKVMYTEN